MNQTLEIYIEELVLHGFERNDRYQVAEAIEAELTRLFATQGIPHSLQHPVNIPSINAGTLQMPGPAGRKITGVQLAGSIYSSFNTGKPKASVK